MLKRIALVIAVVLLVASAKVAWSKMEERGWVRTPTVGGAMRALVIAGALFMNPEAVWASRDQIRAEHVVEDAQSPEEDDADGDAPPKQGRFTLAGRVIRWFLRR